MIQDEASGPPDGPPVLLLHGLAGSGRWWRPTIGALAGRFRVHALSLRGVRLAVAARELAGWMEEQGLARASLVGHSMGGLIGAELAAERPELVDRLVLVSAPLAPLGGYRRGAWGLARGVARLPPAFVPLLVADALRAGPVNVLRGAHEAIGARAPGLERIRAPTLLLWGDHDTLVPPRIGREAARRIPDARLVLIPAGHNPMWQSPSAFNDALVAFLST